MIYKRILLPVVTRRDLESIEKRILSLGEDADYQLIVDDVEHDNLESLSRNQNQATSVQMVRDNPFVTIVFHESDSYFIASRDVEESVVGELNEIILRTQRLSLWYTTAILPRILIILIATMITLISTVYIFDLSENVTTVFLTIILLSGFLSLSFITFVLNTRLNHFSQINLNPQGPSFFVKYRRQISFAVLSGLIGAVAGTLLTFAVNSILS